MGSLLIELLEEVLPARFGGAPTDYQVVEEEEQGLPRVSILVAPRVGDIDEPALIDTVFRALRTQTGGELMTDQWQQGNTLRIVRREPYINSRAKILPLHILTTPSKPS